MRVGGEHICGGSLISNQWVITAAHCTGDALSTISFLMGTANRLNDASGVVRKASKVYVHRSFSSRTNDYDIAAYKLSSIVTITSSLKAIALPGNNITIPSNTNLTVSGWGSTNSDQYLPTTILNAVNVPALTNAQCKQYYGSTSIKDRMICAGVIAGGKDSCQGDSGGPLIWVINGVPTLVGIVSWGVGCALPNYPGVYTRVPYLRAWITNTTGV